jgi:hypothetical protein
MSSVRFLGEAARPFEEIPEAFRSKLCQRPPLPVPPSAKSQLGPGTGQRFRSGSGCASCCLRRLMRACFLV